MSAAFYRGLRQQSAAMNDGRPCGADERSNSRRLRVFVRPDGATEPSLSTGQVSQLASIIWEGGASAVLRPACRSLFASGVGWGLTASFAGRLARFSSRAEQQLAVTPVTHARPPHRPNDPLVVGAQSGPKRRIGAD